MKVCIAGDDIASQFKDFRKAFEKQGVNVCTYVHRKPNSVIITQDSYDYIGFDNIPSFFRACSKFLRGFNNKILRLIDFYITRYLIFFYNRKLLKRISEDTDVFIFMWSSFWLNYSDLAYLKKKGKKIVFIFCGDDARWYWSMKQDFETSGLKIAEYPKDYNYGIIGLIDRLQRMRMAEKYADLIYSKREQAQLQLRSYYHFPMTIDLTQFEGCNKKQNTIPIVIHTPSNQTVKGTKYVLEVLDRLEMEGVKFEKSIISNLSNTEVLQQMCKADIMIDQLLLPGGGKAASEALASGCVVLSLMGYNKYKQASYYDYCPIIDVDTENLYNKLKEIIQDLSTRKIISSQGPLFAKSYLDVELFIKMMLKRLENEIADEKIMPTFFRDKFDPENFIAKCIYNYYTRLISKASWYKSDIKSGYRNGLYF